MIVIDEAIANAMSVRKALVLCQVMQWTRFAPIPGPPGAWADHLPFTARETEGIVEGLIGDGLISVTDGLFHANFQEIDALLKPKPKSRRARPKKKRNQREVVAELVEHFSVVSGIAPPIVGKTMRAAAIAVRWWNPLREMLAEAGGDIDATKSAITTTLNEMRERELTISAPASIRKSYTATLAKPKKTGGIW